jgi:crotonobetainyl-CoA:carnitine CoA-transferase CaiB-like acyl-CoA transferase
LGVQLADVGGGSLHAVVGLLAAVIARQQSGVGQYLDVSMTDCRSA